LHLASLAPLRMRALSLWGPRFETPREVVRWLTALQAQEFPLAKWSVAQRTRGATKADVDKAFAEARSRSLDGGSDTQQVGWHGKDRRGHPP
jgi:hypothetical protein